MEKYPFEKKPIARVEQEHVQQGFEMEIEKDIAFSKRMEDIIKNFSDKTEYSNSRCSDFNYFANSLYPIIKNYPLLEPEKQHQVGAYIVSSINLLHQKQEDHSKWVKAHISENPMLRTDEVKTYYFQLYPQAVNLGLIESKMDILNNLKAAVDENATFAAHSLWEFLQKKYDCPEEELRLFLGNR